jgi:hypothetical protein
MKTLFHMVQSAGSREYLALIVTVLTAAVMLFMWAPILSSPSGLKLMLETHYLAIAGIFTVSAIVMDVIIWRWVAEHE